MKVYVQNATKSQKVEATLDKDSGVIIFESGEVSHVIFEKQMQKEIFVYKDGVHCALLGKNKKPEVEPVKDEPVASSPEQSKPSKKPKTK